MGISFQSVVVAGESAIAPIEDVFADVKSGIASGGGLAAESMAVVLKLIEDQNFRTHLAAMVEAFKAL